MEKTNKKYAVVYSLNHKKLVASGVSDYMEVLDAYSDKEVNHLALSEELMSSNIVEPVMLIDITENNRLTEEQMTYLSDLNGKKAIREKREDFEYLKPLLDKPFWKAEQGLIISTDYNTEVFLNSGNKVFPSTDFMIESNKKAEDSTYVHSFNIKSLREAFKEAHEVLEKEDGNSISEIFDNSDRESRVVLIGAIMNDTLGLSRNEKSNTEEIVQMFNDFKDLDEYKDYMNNFGLAASQNDDVKKAYLATKKLEKYAIESIELKDSHQDYVENIFEKEINKLLREMRDSIESKIIATIDEEPKEKVETPKKQKKKHKDNQLSLL